MMITLPTTSLPSLKKFLRDHRDLIYRYVVKEIGKGYTNGADKVKLFKFGETNYVAALNQPEYAVALEEVLEFFVGQEMFEEAATCRDLLTKIKVEDIIRISQTPQK